MKFTKEERTRSEWTIPQIQKKMGYSYSGITLALTKAGVLLKKRSRGARWQYYFLSTELDKVMSYWHKIHKKYTKEKK